MALASFLRRGGLGLGLGLEVPPPLPLGHRPCHRPDGEDGQRHKERPQRLAGVPGGSQPGQRLGHEIARQGEQRVPGDLVRQAGAVGHEGGQAADDAQAGRPEEEQPGEQGGSGGGDPVVALDTPLVLRRQEADERREPGERVSPPEPVEALRPLPGRLLAGLDRIGHHLARGGGLGPRAQPIEEAAARLLRLDDLVESPFKQDGRPWEGRRGDAPGLSGLPGLVPGRVDAQEDRRAGRVPGQAVAGGEGLAAGPAGRRGDRRLVGGFHGHGGTWRTSKVYGLSHPNVCSENAHGSRKRTASDRPQRTLPTSS